MPESNEQSKVETPVKTLLELWRIPHIYYEEEAKQFIMPDFFIYPDNDERSAYIECKLKGSALNFAKYKDQCDEPKPNFSGMNEKTSFMIDYYTLAKHHKRRPCYFIIRDTSNPTNRIWVQEYNFFSKTKYVQFKRRNNPNNPEEDKGKRVYDMGTKNMFSNIEDSLRFLLKKADQYAIERNNLTGYGPIWHSYRSPFYRNLDRTEIHVRKTSSNDSQSDLF